MGSEDLIDVPSGEKVRFYEFVNGAPGDGLTYRFRFILPTLGADGAVPDPEVTELDMAHLCHEYALPRLATTGPKPNRIVISLADRETEFGIANPRATEVFESYSIEDDACIWEAF